MENLKQVVFDGTQRRLWVIPDPYTNKLVLYFDEQEAQEAADMAETHYYEMFRRADTPIAWEDKSDDGSPQEPLSTIDAPTYLTEEVRRG